MKFDGLDYKRVDSLAHRPADPARDKDHAGDPIPKNYIAIVSRKDCISPSGFETEQSLKKAPILPDLAYVAPNQAMGPARHQTRRGRFFWVHKRDLARVGSKTCSDRDNVTYAVEAVRDEWVQVWVDEYWAFPMYLVHNGSVFRTSVQVWKKPAIETRVASKHRSVA